MNIAITSDTHFGHINIARYSKRPVIQPGDLDADGEWVSREVGAKRTQEMDEIMIQNWNAVCDKDTVVYRLGDVFYGHGDSWNRIVHRLNFGFLHVIKGNHDKPFALWYKRNKHPNIYFYDSYLETKIAGQDVTLCHYSMRVWNKSHRGAWNLYGHSHNSLPDDPHAHAFDVGVDCHQYFPLRWSQVEKIMAAKEFKPKDHHR